MKDHLLAAILIGLLLVGGSVLAQSISTAQINGVVRDQTGAL
jgi:hypothetical protein